MLRSRLKSLAMRGVPWATELAGIAVVAFGLYLVVQPLAFLFVGGYLVYVANAR